MLFSAERKTVYIKDKPDKLFDAATGAPIGGDAPADVDNVRINNRLRRTIDAALGGLTLLARDPGKRFDAAQAVFKSHEASALPTLETAIGKEQDARVKRALTEARAAVVLFGDDANDADKIDAVAVDSSARRSGRDGDALGSAIRARQRR